MADRRTAPPHLAGVDAGRAIAGPPGRVVGDRNGMSICMSTRGLTSALEKRWPVSGKNVTLKVDVSQELCRVDRRRRFDLRQG